MSIRNFEELEAKLKRYHQLSEKEKKVIAKVDARMLKIAERQEKDTKPILGEMNSLKDEIESFMRDQEAKRGIRSKKLPTATVSLVNQTNLVIHDEAKTVKKLQQKHPDLIRTILKPDKEGMKKLGFKELKLVGASLASAKVLRISFTKK